MRSRLSHIKSVRSTALKQTSGHSARAKKHLELTRILKKSEGGPISAEEARFLLANNRAEKKHKYGARPVEIEGHWFASTFEGRRYSELRVLERAGRIHHLTLQPKFPLFSGQVLVGMYVADFSYVEVVNHITLNVVEDVKGVRLALYKLKLKLFRKSYPMITFREISHGR